MATYEELKRRRDEIKNLLNSHSDLKGHRTYKKLEDDLRSVKAQIKGIFRDAHNAKQDES